VICVHVTRVVLVTITICCMFATVVLSSSSTAMHVMVMFHMLRNKADPEKRTQKPSDMLVS
jgi:hypothetical protein